ncbi:hypothetical protein IKF28_02415 [Candidatus Saccharibacteria bacterium]|nr:hypothetical protein [Candidatus Saccharibacteria bacterium]
MSVFTSFGIIVIAMLILGLLQLVPGIFALFYHYALGKFNKAKASDLALFFILGTETISVLFFLAVYFIISIFFLDNSAFENQPLKWCLFAIFIILSIFCLCFYYRHGKGSTLFIPRSYPEAVDNYIKTVKNRSGAFLLGILSCSCELILTFPLYIIVSISILQIENSGLPANLPTALFVFTPIVPLFSIYFQYYYGYTLADIIKKRIKTKPFIRIALGVCYMAIAILIIYTGAI